MLLLVLCLVLTASPPLAQPLTEQLQNTVQDRLNRLAQAPDTMMIRFRIAGDPTILAAYGWAADGSQVFPPTNAALTAPEEGAAALHARLRQLAAGGQRHLSVDPLAGGPVYACDPDLRFCAALDTAGLAQELGAPEDALRDALAVGPPAPRYGFVWAGLGIAGLVCVILVTRRRATRGGVAPVADPDAFGAGDLTVFPRRLEAERGALRVALSPRDLALLRHLWDHRGQVVSRDDLYDAGWGRDFMPNSRALDQHIITLRRKLDPDRRLPEIIETVRGAGYRLIL